MLNNSQKMRELKNLGLRVYNNQMRTIEENGVLVNKDEQEIIEICNRTFGHGTPSPENLHLFNEFLVTTAEAIVEPSVQYILGLLADFQVAPAGGVKVYKMPKTTKSKWLFTAKGTGTDLVRISPEETSKVAVPTSMSYGAYYEITTFRANPVVAFQDAVTSLATAKLDYYFDRIFELTNAAAASGEIPANNVADGSNLSIAEYQKVENTMIRLSGGRPVMVGDMSMINHFANLIPTTQTNLLTDDFKAMLRDDLVPSQISKTVAVPFPNSWTDDNNSEARFDQQTAFVFPGGVTGKKPFAITEFGVQRQYSTIDPEMETVNLKVVFESDITLLNARYLGLVKDDSITLV